MRTIAILIALTFGTPLVAQTALPQIEPDSTFPIWGSPDERRAFFDAERDKLEAERARIEAERQALAEAQALQNAQETEAQAASGTTVVVNPTYRPRADLVQVCDPAPRDRPRPFPDGEFGAQPSGTTGFVRRSQTAPAQQNCRYVRRSRDGVVLQYDEGGFSGRLQLTGPNGGIVIETR